MLHEVTDRNFDLLVESATVPVLVEFWQPGCGHCRALMGELEALQRELEGRLLILTMNVQDNFQIPAELEISSLPALALYRDGVFQRFIGGIGKKDAVRAQLALGNN
jgi:thioredoxin-like negative regulator of GroEL